MARGSEREKERERERERGEKGGERQEERKREERGEERRGERKRGQLTQRGHLKLPLGKVKSLINSHTHAVYVYSFMLVLMRVREKCVSW